MTKIGKVIKQIFDKQSIYYADAETLLLKLGYRLRITESHHIFKKIGRKQIVLKNRKELHVYQILELQQALMSEGYNHED